MRVGLSREFCEFCRKIGDFGVSAQTKRDALSERLIQFAEQFC